MSPAGRPPLNEEDRKDDQVRVRLTASEKSILDRAAAISGRRTGAWLRELGIAAAEPIIAAAEQAAAATKKPGKKKS